MTKIGSLVKQKLAPPRTYRDNLQAFVDAGTLLEIDCGDFFTWSEGEENENPLTRWVLLFERDDERYVINLDVMDEAEDYCNESGEHILLDLENNIAFYPVIERTVTWEPA